MTAHALPRGWSIERESAAAAVLHWGKAARPGSRPGIVVPPSARLEYEIRYSPYGWMWASCFWRDSEHGGAVALEKWRRFAATPAGAALGAARDVLERLREDNTRSRDGLAMRAAALDLVEAITRAPALDLVPQPAPAWPLAEQAGRPAGYYRVDEAPQCSPDENDVVWWTGSRWLNVRPGIERGACINRDRTESLSTWPRAVAWALEVPVSPEDSRQFDAWAGASADEDPADTLQSIPAAVVRGTAPQLDLFA